MDATQSLRYFGPELVLTAAIMAVLALDLGLTARGIERSRWPGIVALAGAAAGVALRPHARVRRLQRLLQGAARAGASGRGLDVARLARGARAAERGRVLHAAPLERARDAPHGGGGQPADGLPVARVCEPHVLRADGLPPSQPPV